jgi:hypothetical protein
MIGRVEREREREVLRGTQYGEVKGKRNESPPEEDSNRQVSIEKKDHQQETQPKPKKKKRISTNQFQHY